MSVGAWPHGDPNDVIRNILAQRQFLRGKPADSGPSLLQRVLGWLAELFGPMLRWIYGGVSHAGAAGTVVLVVLSALAAIGLACATFVLAMAIARSWQRRRRSTAGAGDPWQQVAPDALRQEAAAAADAGEYGRAVALLFRAALLLLDRAAVVTFDAARTAGEYRRLVRHAVGRGAAPFDELAARFVFATFSTRATRRVDYDAAERAYATFARDAVAT